MNELYDVHLIFNNLEKDAVARVDEELRNRGLLPWFWDKDAGPNWYQEEVDSITKRTPVSAVFLGPAGWGPNFHTKLTSIACQAGRPTVFVLLPGWPQGAETRFPELSARRWVEFTSIDDRSAIKTLAQRVVDGAYEVPEEPTPAAAGQGATGRNLVVYVPARSQTVESWTSLRTRLAQEPELHNSAWYPHRYNGADWSRESLEDLGLGLTAAVGAALLRENKVNGAGPIEHITLMGHSFGGVLARMAYLMAAAQYTDKLKSGSDWWRLVDRIVLFAAPNRGIEKRRLRWRQRLAARWPFGQAGLLMRDQLVGSGAITNLRIRWIRHFAALPPGQRPTVVQLLAKGDDWVDRDDSLDIEQFPNAWQQDVPGASHADLHQVPEGDELRYAVLRQGILEAKPAGLPDRESERRNPVVIVLHGIRASNETWVKEVSDHIDERAPNALVVTPAYGYFPMLDFALPWLRARKARELQAQYSDALVRNPRARFCFVGHSNGTYMLGRSLIDLAGMRFHRVALAASVLPRDYQWTKCFTRGQVHHMTNHRASRDVPVGIVCNLLRSLGMRDVGTAGYHGFLGGRAEIKEVYYYDGGHSEPVEKDNVRALAEYALNGRTVFPSARVTTPAAQFVSRLSESTIVGLAIFAALCCIVLGMMWALFNVLTLLASWPSLLAITVSAFVVLVFVYLMSRYY